MSRDLLIISEEGQWARDALGLEWVFHNPLPDWALNPLSPWSAARTPLPHCRATEYIGVQYPQCDFSTGGWLCGSRDPHWHGAVLCPKHTHLQHVKRGTYDRR